MPGADPNVATVVLDASVAVRWVTVETGTEEAVALLSRPVAWLAPRLLLVEAAAALRRKTAGGALRFEIAAEALSALIDAVRDGIVALADDETIVASALTLAASLNHKVPDCVYLALAEREGAGLATADRGLAALAESRGIPVFRVPSA